MKKSSQAPEYQQVLRTLVEMRRAAGMTQRALAAKLDREPSFVWRIEKGERRLDILEFFWVCRALGADARSVYASLCSSFQDRSK